MIYSREQLIFFLTSRYGKKESEISELGHQELIEMHKEELRRSVNTRLILVREQYQDESSMNQNPFAAPKSTDEYWDELIKAEVNSFMLYSVIEEMVVSFEMEQIENMLEKHANDSSYHNIYKKFRVKLRQYQEELIDEIDDLSKFLPEEEHFNFMLNAEKYHSNIPKLRVIINELKQNSENRKIERIGYFRKKILSEYYPDEFKEEYKEYFNEKVVRVELTKKILDYTTRYTESQLQRKNVDELQQIVDYYIEQRKKKEDAEHQIEKFQTMLSRLVYTEEESEYNKVVGLMMAELQTNKILELIRWMQKQDDTIAEKLYTTYLAYMSTGTKPPEE